MDAKWRGAGNPPLKDQFRAGSSRFAQRAMREYLEGDRESFLIHAGTALEHLLKAYLASVEPSLVADGHSFDSLLHASGQGRHARVPPEQMRTITTREALTRCGQILPAVGNLASDLVLLVEARNGVVHLAFTSSESVDRSLVAFLRACRQVLGEAGWDEEEFWGEFQEMFTTRLSESSEAAAVRASEAITSARLRFQETYGHLDDEAQSIIARTIEASYALKGYEEQLVECPACGNQAFVSGRTDVDWEVDWETDEFGEPYASGASPTVTFFPGYLHCKVCGLELDGEDEIANASLDESWQLEDVDPADFYEDWSTDDIP